MGRGVSKAGGAGGGAANSTPTYSTAQQKYFSDVQDRVNEMVKKGTAENVDLQQTLEKDGTMVVSLSYDNFVIETKKKGRKTIEYRRATGRANGVVKVDRNGNVIDSYVG